MQGRASFCLCIGALLPISVLVLLHLSIGSMLAWIITALTVFFLRTVAHVETGLSKVSKNNVCRPTFKVVSTE